MKTKLLIMLAVTTLCAAPTCGQIEVPKPVEEKQAPQEPTPDITPDAPTDLSAVTPVAKERDERMNQITILLATFCIDASAEKWAVDAGCVTRGIHCVIRLPNDIWSNGSEVLGCAIDARKGE